MLAANTVAQKTKKQKRKSKRLRMQIQTNHLEKKQEQINKVSHCLAKCLCVSPGLNARTPRA